MISIVTVAYLYALSSISASYAFSSNIDSKGNSARLTSYSQASLSDESTSFLPLSTTDTPNILGKTRRLFLVTSIISAGLTLTTLPQVADAKSDCFDDCLKNCKAIAPKDPGYCLENCKGYCEQEDRTDGLSGSVSSSGGEVGILGTSTVVKGEDKPPTVNIPGLDFTSSEGRKLLGY